MNEGRGSCIYHTAPILVRHSLFILYSFENFLVTFVFPKKLSTFVVLVVRRVAIADIKYGLLAFYAIVICLEKLPPSKIANPRTIGTRNAYAIAWVVLI